MSSCPRCHGFMVADLDGSSCINCGRVEYQPLGPGVCLATMQPSGLTATTTLERSEDTQDYGHNHQPDYWQWRKERQRIEDKALGEATARRLGVMLEDLQSNAQDDVSREQRREAIVELRSLGLSFYRIGNLLARSDKTIRAVLEREKRARR